MYVVSPNKKLAPSDKQISKNSKLNTNYQKIESLEHQTHNLLYSKHIQATSVFSIDEINHFLMIRHY